MKTTWCRPFVWASLALLSGTAVGWLGRAPSTATPSAVASIDFVLSDSAGTSRRLSDYAGKVVLVYLGYTHCPDVCPTALVRMRNVRAALGEEGMFVQGLFVTLDPERDAGHQLEEYVTFFDSSFVALRGSNDAVRDAASAFGITYELSDPASGDGDYLLDHTSVITLIDPAGRVTAHFADTTPFEQMLDDVRVALSTRS